MLFLIITAGIAGSIGFLAEFAMLSGGSQRNNGIGLIGEGLSMQFIPLAAILMLMAITRKYEYSADKVGADICGSPDCLAGALRLIERQARGTTDSPARENWATAHIFIITARCSS